MLVYTHSCVCVHVKRELSKIKTDKIKPTDFDQTGKSHKLDKKIFDFSDDSR